MSGTISNRKARYDYHLSDRYEAGIVLKGTEIKSVRAGRLTLADSHVKIENSEAFLMDAHIGAYEHGTVNAHDAKRPRKLLLHRREIRKLENKTRSPGITVVPTKAYFSKGKLKLEIAIARGKHDYDKREAIKEKEDRRLMRSFSKFRK